MYVALREAMNAHGLNVGEDEMHSWHGVQKTEVMDWFLQDRNLTGRVDLDDIEDSFVSALEDAYFSPSAEIALISNKLPFYFEQLRMNGVQVGLNTGYPASIQNKILDKLGMKPMVDVSTCAYNVRSGRPSPYMVHQLMEKAGVMNAQNVAKAGDTVADIGEGRNAQCGLVIGVLSGADSATQLQDADLVVGDITDVPLEVYAAGGAATRSIFQMARKSNTVFPQTAAAPTASYNSSTPKCVGKQELLHSGGGHSISITVPVHA